MNRNMLISLSAILIVLSAFGGIARAHCQVPCGIYDDPARFVILREHVTTIEKSMREIERLGAETPVNYNQVVRWVNNKEKHADELSEIVTYYFLAQRIKAPTTDDAAARAKYIKQLVLTHGLVTTAMKAKQTTDLENCAKLRELIDQFEAVYFGKEAAVHGHDHNHAPGHTH